MASTSRSLGRGDWLVHAEMTNLPSPTTAQLQGLVQRLKRVFGIDIHRCEHCGGEVKIIASIIGESVRWSAATTVLRST
jgi:hypothetical protein